MENTMKALLVLLVVAIGIWNCTTTSSATSAAAIKTEAISEKQSEQTLPKKESEALVFISAKLPEPGDTLLYRLIKGKLWLFQPQGLGFGKADAKVTAYYFSNG